MRRRIILAALSCAAVILILTGCSGVLIPENKVITLSQTESSPVNITSFMVRQGGRVQDISEGGSQVLSIGQSSEGSNSSTIDLFDTASGSLVNLVSSDTQLGSAEFTDKGIYYTKRTTDSTLNGIYYQIMWYSLDKSTETTVTAAQTITSGVFTCWDDDKIAYISGGDLVFATPDGETKRYTLDKDLTVKKMIWSPEHQVMMLLGTTDDGQTFDLYKLSENESGFLRKTIVAREVTDFDYAEQTGKLAYLKQENIDLGLYITDAGMRAGKGRSQLRGNFESISFYEDGQALIYTQAVPDTNRNSVSVWKLSLGETKPVQISAPMQITSAVCSAADGSPVYFSASDSYLAESAPQFTTPNLLCMLSYQEN